MLSSELVVGLVHSKTCFVNLPLHWADALWDEPAAMQPGGVVLELAWRPAAGTSKQAGKTAGKQAYATRKAYVGWAGGCVAPSAHPTGSTSAIGSSGPFGSSSSSSSSSSSDPASRIEIDASYARALGLVEGQRVSATFVRDIQEAASVSVEPATIDDWEILELHAGYLEEQVLNQLRIVYPGQTFTIWVHHQACITLKLVSLDPDNQLCLRLSENAEIIVAPKTRDAASKAKELTPKPDDSQAALCPPFTLRFLPADHTRLPADVASISPWTVLVSPASLPSDRLVDGSRVYIQHLEYDRVMRQPASAAPGAESQQQTAGVPHAAGGQSQSTPQGPSDTLPHAFATIRVVPHVPQGHAILGPALCQILCIDPFAQLRIEHVKDSSILAAAAFKQPIDLVTLSTSLSAVDAARLVVEWVSGFLKSPSDECLMFDGMPIPLGVGGPTGSQPEVGKLVFKKKDAANVVASGADRHQKPSLVVAVRVGDVAAIEFGARVNANEAKPRYGSVVADISNQLQLAGFEALLDDTVGFFAKCLLLKTAFSSLSTPTPGGLLLYGPSGSGKSTLARVAALRLARYHRMHHTIVKCTQLKQVTPAKVKEAFETALFKAVWHAPSVVVFDDLDALIASEAENTDGTRSRVLGHAFFDLVSRITTHAQVFVMATAQDKSTLHGMLVERHAFGSIVHIRAPDKVQRVTILRHLIASAPSLAPALVQTAKQTGDQSTTKASHILNLDAVASQMDGYVVADILQLLERAQQSHAMRRIKEHAPAAVLSMPDFTDALSGFRPSSLRSVKLHTSDVSWSDIGGMEDTKAMLLQTLQWPTLYPQIFASSPIRLRSGLLLFGYPGCGKTLLASAVAKECGLNFISVKGPELLNKYIGASEKAVRDLFERAQAARPCCLFFDEFDSIAPRRGHDNTGVTDRVVNQLLTQMDGAEGLQGVFVLAATSRPDLIDPALLRPGRLDKAILCDMPSMSDRIQIMLAISAKIPLGPDVSVASIAQETEGLSGADLQGLLNTAQLAAIRESMDEILELGKSAENGVESKQSKSSPSVPFVVVSGHNSVSRAGGQSKLQTRLAALQKAAAGLAEGDGASESAAKEPRQQILTYRRHIETALVNVRPSVSVADRTRLSAVYAKFLRGDSGDVPVATRTSLA
ncbi:P-loop containing nucleoside triphosphate hydrolase protein [Entophlyctis helioformis]|nr:P-loop containing nucleoside triphosphate hydrolase protein [Entophlyctis helioformis]